MLLQLTILIKFDILANFIIEIQYLFSHISVLIQKYQKRTER